MSRGQTGRPIAAASGPFGLFLVAALMAGLGGCAGIGERDQASRAAAENARLGLGYMEQGDYDRAEETLHRALGHDPEYVDAHHYLGELYRRQGEFARSQEHYAEALRLDGDDPALRNNHGVLLCSMGEVEAATREFMAAAGDRRYARRSQALENAADCHLGIGDPAEAAVLYQRARQRSPRRDALAIGEARAHLLAGDPQSSRRALNDYIEMRGERDGKARELEADIAAALEETR